MEREDHDCERMTDIVQRLTAKDNLTSVINTCTCKPGRHPGELADLMKEAADEILRLRAENEKLHREAAIRIDQIEREQEAHLETIADYNWAAVENEKLHQSQEQLGLFFVKIGDRGYYVCEAVWKEIVTLREALSAERERCAKIAEQARDDTCDGPVAWSMADGIAAAIRESGE